jgi:hypothetical protein
MQLILALTCDAAHERPDGKLDIMGVFNELSAPGFPAMQQRMTAVFVVQWSPEEGGEQLLRADLVDEDGQRILTIEAQTRVMVRAAERAPPQTRLIQQLDSVVFPHAGRYTFELVAGGDTHQTCSIYVSQLPGPDQPRAAS